MRVCAVSKKPRDGSYLMRMEDEPTCHKRELMDFLLVRTYSTIVSGF